jgi:transposase InsO family protein
MSAELRRRGWVVNHKRMRHLMERMGLKVRVKRKRRQTTNSDHPFPHYPKLVLSLSVVCPDQVWLADITYVRLGQGFVYLAVIMDVFTRTIRGWNLSQSQDERLTLSALQKALSTPRVPHIHHSDQGSSRLPRTTS